MNLNQWAIKWQISAHALNDLKYQMGVQSHFETNTLKPGISEAGVSSRVLIEASQKGMWLMRNNVGAAKTSTGRLVRYGLANESKAQNKILKSSDFIGVRQVLIKSNMIGQTIGQFMAIEVKEENWDYVGDEKEIAQKNFIDAVLSRGGYAAFVNKEGTL